MVAERAVPDFSHAQDIELAGHQSKVVTLDWNCTGEYLATGAGETSLLVWRAQQHGLSPLKSLKSSSPQQLVGLRGPFYVAWHPTEPHRLVTLDDQAIRFWDNRTGKITSSVTAAVVRNKRFLCAIWAPNGYDMAVTSVNNYNIHVDSRKSAVIKSVHANVELNQAAISPDGTTMLQGIGTGDIQVCDFPSFEVRDSLAGHMERVVACKFDPSGRLFVTGSHDSTATVWDYETLLPIKSHFNVDWTVNAAGFSHDSQHIAIGGDENEIKISDTYTGAVEHTIPCHGTGYALSWNPKHMLLAYSGREERGDRGAETGHVNVFAPSVL